ncbi:MAG TPA: glycosyltransferase [Gaiellaceae bacterium]|nr:glycosyltransferase [Gaiellaceae bacterium]
MTEGRGTIGVRLAVFAPSLARGGAERGALKLCEGLGERGFDVDLVLARAEGPRMAEVPTHVRVVDLGARRVLTSLPRLIRYIRSEQPLAVASVLDHANIVLLWAAKLSRYRGRVVVIEQNTLSHAARNGKSRRDRMMPRFVRRFYPWADFVVGVSAGVVTDLRSLVDVPSEKLCIIANPIVDSEIVEKSHAPVDHPWFEDDVPVFVAMGRLRPQKDFPTLLHAFAGVRARRPARLVLLGEGSERAKLEALARQLGIAADVSLPGSVSNPYAFVARSVAFVLSSRWEGLPTVLVEAASCGVPVIATDCPSGPREILDGGRYGALVPVGDAEALAAAMECALEGALAKAPAASWRPYESDYVVDRFLELMAPECAAALEVAAAPA